MKRFAWFSVCVCLASMCYPAVSPAAPGAAEGALSSTTDACGVLAFDGGSNFLGNSGPSAGMSAPNQTSRLVPGAHEYVNVSFAGKTFADMTADAPTRLDTRYDADARYHVLVVQTSTVRFGSLTPAATVYADLATYVAARKAVGWSVYVLTCNPIAAGGDRQALVEQYNALLVSGLGGGDGVVDFSKDPCVGVAGAQAAHPDYWADAAHWNDAGSAVIAGYIYRTIEPAVAPLVVADTTPPVTIASGTGGLWLDGDATRTPGATDNPGGRSNKRVTVILTATDAGSGVAVTEYRPRGAAGWTRYAGPFVISAPGVSAYEYRSTDLAGNVEATKTFTVRIAPSPSIIDVSPSSAKRGAIVTITGSDFGASRNGSLVKFGVRTCAGYGFWSDTQIRCKVPAKAVYGSLKVEVATAAGVSNGVSFRVKR